MAARPISASRPVLEPRSTRSAPREASASSRASTTTRRGWSCSATAPTCSSGRMPCSARTTARDADRDAARHDAGGGRRPVRPGRHAVSGACLRRWRVPRRRATARRGSQAVRRRRSSSGYGRCTIATDAAGCSMRWIAESSVSTMPTARWRPPASWPTEPGGPPRAVPRRARAARRPAPARRADRRRVRRLWRRPGAQARRAGAVAAQFDGGPRTPTTSGWGTRSHRRPPSGSPAGSSRSNRPLPSTSATTRARTSSGTWPGFGHTGSATSSDEGGGAAIEVRPVDDGDLSVESIDALDAVLSAMTT